MMKDGSRLGLELGRDVFYGYIKEMYLAMELGIISSEWFSWDLFRITVSISFSWFLFCFLVSRSCFLLCFVLFFLVFSCLK